MQGISLKGIVGRRHRRGELWRRATTALAAVHVFNLEASNTAAAKTSVTGSFNDKLLQLTNSSSGDANATSRTDVAAGKPRLTVTAPTRRWRT